MKKRIVTALTIAGLGLAALPASAAYSNVATWNGNGSHDIESTFTLDHELCGIINGAPVDGPYAYWVLTASRATNAEITIDSVVNAMSKHGNGTFSYLQDMGTWIEPSAVSATYDGSPKRATLTLGHGCTQNLE